MKEWKIPEKHLPESIYVRTYESRMDLLRAVIVGAAGTPYHDGLFFFDIVFPSDYPNQPPKGLVLNARPYFNDSGRGTHIKDERWVNCQGIFSLQRGGVHSDMSLSSKSPTIISCSQLRSVSEEFEENACGVAKCIQEIEQQYSEQAEKWIASEDKCNNLDTNVFLFLSKSVFIKCLTLATY
ncbi:putative ubiquitin-conjugating enzyme E2 39 [Capsicum baccatum]|uniref:Ubiquitin-conjugating enzyme E2 39 n=1 Tax=Capsicum baccatum TaxID=33114 RepID=A0A2G2VJK9_CAPBA|nr:putative ubiquitin-conjugating enzyme E2 39 [Capsicum baccatum]